MASSADDTEVREVPGEGLGLHLVLYVEGQESGRATVHEDVLADLSTTFGLSRDQVASQLRDALLELHEGRLEKVQLDRLEEKPQGSRRFVARYTFRDYRTITEGLVWYDVIKSETGPSDVSPVVRNKLRFEVHAKLVGNDPNAEKLRKALG